jgi:hypothetical protein
MKNPLEAFKTLLFILSFIIIFLVAGCYGEGKEQITDNKEYHVTYLFTVEGNKVYRFFDGSHPHYVVIGPGALQTNGEYSNGKSVTPEEINTVKIEARKMSEWK